LILTAEEQRMQSSIPLCILCDFAVKQINPHVLFPSAL
jgi:hypothetical protein